MPELPASGGWSHISRIGSKVWPWLVFISIGLFMGQWVASPSYAWWFTPQAPFSSIAPTHQKGLVVSPIASSLVPQFVLQPLSTTEVEAPPSSLASVQASVLPTPTPKPAVQAERPSTLAVTNGSISEQMLIAVNKQRQSHGLPALSLNAQLSASAQKYAERMATEHFFSHTSPEGIKFKERNVAAGYTNWLWMGENIAYGQDSVSEVMSDWMDSPSHRDNILHSRARELGVGYAGAGTKYWVQEFGER